MRSVAFWVLGAAPLLDFARADLPVHCLGHEIVGEWEFTYGPSSGQRSSCGHHRPDNQESQPPISVDGETGKISVTLASPNRATTSSGQGGNWTMIYDEAFEVNVGTWSYLAFSKFDLWHEGSETKNQSHCDSTMLGWYHNAERTQFGCYYGKKVASSQSNARGSLMEVDDTAMPGNDYDTPLTQDYHEDMAGRLNMLQTGWTAKAYGHMAGKTMRELNSYAGIRRSMPLAAQVGSPGGVGGMSSSPSLAQVQHRLRRKGRDPVDFAAMTEMGVSFGNDDSFYDPKPEPMPKSFDWRNHSGRNFLEPVIDQGDCGSCYTVATVRMLSARNKIRLQDPLQLPFSISFPLYCAEYNQGCDGGYAFLVTKWSEDVGLVPATCAKYSERGQCGIDAACLNDMGARYRAKNHRYVGGFYGADSEEAMARELVKNGPLVVSFEPKNDVMYYNGGIYKSGADPHSEWQRVDHAVLLVGYGEENGQKYWTLQNSWGPEWGEQGFFRMARGINDSGMESIAVAADVVEEDRPEILTNFLATL